jgi:hypothetical protein
MIHDDVLPRTARGAAQVIEDVRQLAEPELGGSTTAARVLGEADGGPGFGGHGAGV